MFGGIKRSKTDILFSQFIRERDNWQCVRNSHFWGRGWKSTRFDPENCDSLCKLPCHHKWGGEERDFYKAFKVKQLGQKAYDALEVRAKTPQKVDETEIALGLKLELQKLKENKKFLK